MYVVLRCSLTMNKDFADEKRLDETRHIQEHETSQSLGKQCVESRETSTACWQTASADAPSEPAHPADNTLHGTLAYRHHAFCMSTPVQKSASC